MTRGNLSGNGRKPASHVRAVRRIKIRQSRGDCRKSPRHVRGFLHKPTKNCARRARFVVGKLDRKRGFDRNHPCFCLCFGFWQMTITLPLRRMILHFSQIGFTDGLTFMTFYLHQNFWWDGTPENRRPLALGSHTRLRPLFYHRHTPSGVIESENRYAIFIKSAGFARAFDSPTQRPRGASFGYQKQVSLELVFVYRGLLKSPISKFTCYAR